jgi:UDP-N-acetylmuramoyl-tripeptide--D-alanyl-D-alanine ligase
MNEYLIFFAILFTFWLFHFLRRLLFWLYLWQVKGYRLDRFNDEISQNRKLLWPRSASLSFFLILFSLLLSKKNFLFESFGLGLFFVLGAYSLYLLLKGEWKWPRFTLKAIFIFLLSFLLTLFILWQINRTLSLVLFLLHILILEVFFPWIFLGIFLFFQAPAYLYKNFLYLKAKKKREKLKNLLVIGITGSYGKTTTKEFLYQILKNSGQFKVKTTRENENTGVAIAKKIIKELQDDDQIFVCEVGAYRKGEIKKMCKILKPQIGVLTGISEQHLSLFGSFSNILFGKYELIASLPENGTAFFNATNKHCQKLAQKTAIKKYLYSLNEGPFDFFAKEIEEKEDSLKFKVVINQKEVREFYLNFGGIHNVENFLGALAVAWYLKIPLETIQEIAPRLYLPKTALRKFALKNGGILLDGSYSQNPNGVLAGINYLSKFNFFKIIILTCLIELGKSSSKWHKKIGEEIGKVFDLAIVTTPYHFSEINLGVKSQKGSKTKLYFLNNPKKVIEKISPYLSKKVAIFISGRIDPSIKKEIFKNEAKTN